MSRHAPGRMLCNLSSRAGGPQKFMKMASRIRQNRGRWEQRDRDYSGAIKSDNLSDPEHVFCANEWSVVCPFFGVDNSPQPCLMQARHALCSS
jgi:hypothetical protein